MPFGTPVGVDVMKCRKCKRQFFGSLGEFRRDDTSSPGLFFLIGAGFLGGGIMLLLNNDPGATARIWGWALVAISAFVFLQTAVAWGDRYVSGVECPHCQARNIVWPWSL